MSARIAFLALLTLSLGAFTYTSWKVAQQFKLTHAFPVGDFGLRIMRVFRVALGQSKIFRWPWIGLVHALVFWGFCVLLFGSIEMVADGVLGTDRNFAVMGTFYDVMMAAGDVFAGIVLVTVFIFISRRVLLHVQRFEGVEMKESSHIDALVALTLILLLMVSLLLMNASTLALHGADARGSFPLSALLSRAFPMSPLVASRIFSVSWWSHILLIMVFANILPYSKHFHVFLSIPNVFFARIEPLGKLDTLEQVTREVKLMLDPDAQPPADAPAPSRFGVKDVNDGTWHNYLNALTCTECGRCTASCPANITGKLLSPRKIFMDFRARMTEKGDGIRGHGRNFDDGKSLLGSYVTSEELWACTTCNACAEECPVDISHPPLIVDMRRYLAMEEGAMPSGLNALCANIENNGAPWKYSAEDRMEWARGIDVPVMGERAASGACPEYLYWVGCAGAFDDRYKKVARAFAKILLHCGIDFAVLGVEESCNGDAARRAGNEMIFQMQALKNIALMNRYGVRKILTTCPHCYNTFRNEYPDLGGVFEVFHHTQLIERLSREGTLRLSASEASVTYHDPCYLGRGNGEYDSARHLLDRMGRRSEMKRSRSFALCCGAGGAQMFKEAEPGRKEVYQERTEEVLTTGASVLVTSCPFCMTMLTDGLKYSNRETQVKNADVAELVAENLGL